MKVSVVGAGNVGASAALDIAEKSFADEIVLVDVIPDLPQGKGLDMLESMPVKKIDVKLRGSNDFSAMVDSNIVVITAGLPRKPGMTRMDLLKSNIDIVKPVTQNVVKYAPNSKILVVTNPLDVMTYVALKVSGFPPNRVLGMAGILDTTRFRTFVAMELNVSMEDVTTLVLGGHGDAMVPMPRLTSIGGVPALELMSKEQMDRIVKRTREGGGEIVALLKTGSAYYAPGAGIAEMVEAIARDRRRIIPSCAYLRGEYGFNDVCAGVPVLLGKNGVEKIVEIKLTEEEKAQLAKSVNELIATIKEIRDNKLI